MELHAEPYFLRQKPAELGESAALTSFGLIQVSIPESTLLMLDPSRPDSVTEIICDEGAHASVGSAVETSRATLLAATSKGLIEFSPGSPSVRENLGLPKVTHGTFASDDNLERVRFNDGKVGPNGRAYFGVIFDHKDARASRPGQGCVVSIGSAGDWKECIQGVSTPNGGVWETSKEDGTALFYLSDSPAKKINMYRHTLSDDSFTKFDEIDLNPAAWNENPDTWGRPDGFTIGDCSRSGSTIPVLVVAMFSGGAVLVLDPSKRGIESLLATVKVPAPNVTSIALVGSTAFITSGRTPDHPMSGMTFRVDLSSVGVRERVLPKAW